MEVRRSTAVVMVLLVLGLPIAGFVGYNLWQRKQNEAKPAPLEYTSQTKQTVSSAPQTSSAETLIGAIKATVGGTAATMLEARAPRAQVPGYNFFTAPLATEKTQIAFPRAEAELAGVYTKVIEQLKSAGLAIAPNTKLATDTATPTADYTNNVVYCQVGKATVSQGQLGISVSCADKTMYETASKRVKVLHDLYVNAQNPKPGNDLYMSDFSAYASTIQGYAHAETLVTPTSGNPFTALFYQTPDEQWHFFKSASTTLACADFNTPDLKKAYLNQTCTIPDGPNQKPSTVQL